jgi:hypothetical protein
MTTPAVVPCTVGQKKTPQGWQHNHVEIGVARGDSPKTTFPEVQKMWDSAKWRKEWTTITGHYGDVLTVN